MSQHKQKILLQKLNKKQKESFIQYGFYIALFVFIIISHSYLRWNHYRNNTHMSTKEIERKISYDDINNPDPNRTYFYKIKITKTIRSKGFMKVEKIIKEDNLGTWSREKI